LTKFPATSGRGDRSNSYQGANMTSENRHNFELFALELGAVLLLSTMAVSAQTSFHAGTVAPRGVPASVTSFGFGGHPGFHGVPASVTSQGFGAPMRGFHNRPFAPERHFRFRRPIFGAAYVPYAYPYPYYVDDSSYDDSVSNEIQAQRAYDSRQQQSNEDYRRDLNTREEMPAKTQEQASAQPVADQPSTVLIFKDGRQVEVGNYAIVGATLYELNDGRSRKVQLADLDLPATVKENDDRGVEFQVPPQAKLN